VYTPEELQNLSRLLLSVDDGNVELAFELIEQDGVTKSLVSELFAIYKLSRKHGRKAKTMLEKITDQSKGLQHILNRKSYLDGSSPRKKIKSFADDCEDVDALKLAMALYNKFGEGLQYLVSELPEEALKDLLGKHHLGDTFKLEDKKITKIPKFVFEYKDIRELDLSRNQIKTIPADIGKLKKLQKINLSNNKLKKVNKAIGKLTDLEELDLSRNNIEELPPELAQCTKLKKVDVSSNSFQDFPMVLTELPALEVLNMQHISTSYSPGPMPEAFFNFKTDRLIELNFVDWRGGQTRWKNIPRISKVTGTYDDPISMDPLDLAKRAYKQNKEGVTFLYKHADARLRKEILSTFIEDHCLKFEDYTFIGYLPEELKDFDIKKVVLNSGQVHEEFWDSLKNMPNLEVIDFGLDVGVDTNFTSSWDLTLPETIFELKKLKVLKLGHMRLTNAADILPKLTQLEELSYYDYSDVRDNDEMEVKMEEKFGALKKLKNLKKLTLRGFSSDYWNDQPKRDAFLDKIQTILEKWFPNTEVVVGVNSTNSLR
jgi:hypothetical protein